VDIEKRDYKMSQIEIERLLGRLITDAAFRVRVARSLENAVRKEGFTLSKEEMSLLYDSDFSQFDLVGEALNDSIRRT
jgi:hypothetical protein